MLGTFLLFFGGICLGFFLVVLGLGALGLVLAAISFPFFMIRMCIQLWMPELWARAYFCRAVNVATILSALLLFGALLLPWIEMPKPLALLIETGSEFSEFNNKSSALHQQYTAFEELVKIKLFLDNYALVVLLPTLIVGLGGYSIERSRLAVKGKRLTEQTASDA